MIIFENIWNESRIRGSITHYKSRGINEGVQWYRDTMFKIRKLWIGRHEGGGNDSQVVRNSLEICPAIQIIFTQLKVEVNTHRNIEVFIW